MIVHACVCVYREKWLKKKRGKNIFNFFFKIQKCNPYFYIIFYFLHPYFDNSYSQMAKYIIHMPNLVVDIQTNLAHVNHSIYYSNLVQFLLILYLLGFLYKIL